MSFQDITMEEQQTTVLSPEDGGGCFEKGWAMFQETDRRFKETDRRFKEADRRFKETEQLMKEQAEETRKQMRETDRRIGELGNRFGELAEHLVAPNIREKFNALHYTFDKISRTSISATPRTGIPARKLTCCWKTAAWP